MSRQRRSESVRKRSRPEVPVKLPTFDYDGWGRRLAETSRENDSLAPAVTSAAEAYLREVRDVECAMEAARVGADANVIRKQCPMPVDLIAQWQDEATRALRPDEAYTIRQIAKCFATMFHELKVAQVTQAVREAERQVEQAQERQDAKSAEQWRRAAGNLDAMCRSLGVPSRRKRPRGTPRSTASQATVEATPSPKTADTATFAELGIPFPLFEAPAREASEYCGVETCTLCGKSRQHCFELGIGCTVTVECPECGTVNGLDADDRADGICRKCSHTVRFPDTEDEVVTICYSCLRSGRGAITIDTELGMIGWSEAIDGVTHGVPGLNRNDVELITRDDGWVAARLPQEWMLELVHTPTYSSIQGERWQFCCGRPMVYAGAWSQQQFAERAVDGDGRRLFEAIVQNAIPGLWDGKLHDVTGVYVFRCPSCSRLTAIWDIA